MYHVNENKEKTIVKIENLKTNMSVDIGDSTFPTYGVNLLGGFRQNMFNGQTGMMDDHTMAY